MKSPSIEIVTDSDGTEYPLAWQQDEDSCAPTAIFMAKCLYMQQSVEDGVEGFENIANRYRTTLWGTTPQAIMDTIKSVGLPIASHITFRSTMYSSRNASGVFQGKPIVINRGRLSKNKPALVTIAWTSAVDKDEQVEDQAYHFVVAAGTTSAGKVVYLDPGYGLREFWPNSIYKPDSSSVGLYWDFYYTQ